MLVEDDHEIANSLKAALTRAGYNFSWSSNLAEARQTLSSEMPDLILLDLGLPDGDGGELAIELRSDNRTLPIIILTARDDVDDRVVGLDSGADDYMVKPVERKELLARIRAALRRSRIQPQTHEVKVGNLTINLDNQQASRGKRAVVLTKIEFRLLCHLAERENCIVSRDDLLQAVWGYPEGSETNTVDVFISSLRRKLEVKGESRMLFTSYGRGYILRGDE